MTPNSVIRKIMIVSALLPATLTFLSCNACAPTAVRVQVELIDDPSNGCDFATMAATGNHVITIDITDNRTFSRRYNKTNKPSVTYAVDAPSRGPFEFDVRAQETNLTCPPCAKKCSSGKDAKPLWQVVRHENSGATSGKVYKLQMKHIVCSC